MPKSANTSAIVNGGKVSRSAKTGRFISVSKGAKTYAASALSQRTASAIKEKRTDALKRLVNR